jgi:biopolymer transport protein ExbB
MLLEVKYIIGRALERLNSHGPARSISSLIESNEPHNSLREECVMETLLAGGILMIPLGLCAVLSLAFILERVWVLSRIPDEQAAQQTLEEAERALADRGQEAAAQYCSDHKGPLCFIFASLLKRFGTLMLERREFRPTNERLVRLAGQAGAGDLSRFLLEQKELSDLKNELVLETDEAGKVYLSRYLVVLNTIGNISPLLGLFGTILGMITSFEAIAVAGTGDPKVVASGISQALVTTATGLAIAIPTIVAYRSLARRADHHRSRLEVYGLAFVNTLLVVGQEQLDGEAAG